MGIRVAYVERALGKFVSLEKAFREIASGLGSEFETEFVQLPFSSKVYNSILNFLFFKKPVADIYHITGQINFMGLRLPRDRTVLSIMDVRFVNMNHGLKRLVLKKLFLDLPVNRLKYVTAISENVRNEIVQLTGCSPDKVRVLDLPLLSHILPVERREFNAEMPTILQVGTMDNKNVLNLARALNGLNGKLVIVGELSHSQIRTLAENKVDFDNFIGVTDEKMRLLYDSADIVAFCSTYEGFGLPIIEAQVMGKALITSNLSPMKETAGEGACLVDPYSVKSINDGIRKLIADESYRENVIASGKVNCKRFAPDIVAAKYEVLYREILANN